MHISKIEINNFRLLKKTTLDLRKSISLLLGRNNSGKTSFLVLFENFYLAKSFSYNDFPLTLRERIKGISAPSDANELRIQLKLEITYDQSDNLETLSDFILDLDPNNKKVNILFECWIDAKSLIKDSAPFGSGTPEREKFIIKNFDRYLRKSVYSYGDEKDLLMENRHLLIEKKIEDVKRVINLQVIHAKREISSSEGSNHRKALSILATEYFNRENKSDVGFTEINDKMIEMDSALDATYKTFFEPFLRNSKEMLGFEDIKVRSNIQSKELLENSSQVIYGSEDNYLPEHLNGLGFMNMLYLMLIIEIKKTHFLEENRNINLLFIEEPEAHTHPQMQYIFANKIKGILSGIKNLQTIITTHSSHIASQCDDFEDIRYLSRIDAESNVIIKNFHSELSKKYKDPEDFKFLKQYLTLQSSELFFACKLIFIEGTSERIMLPYFIKQYDADIAGDKTKVGLSSQNISVLEVGTNARAFLPFLEFLNIKTLIITDIDTTKDEVGDDGKTYKESCRVSEGDSTSNYTLKHIFEAPDEAQALRKWISDLKSHKLNNNSEVIKVAYQSEENSYHARSFEDAFISVNLEKIKANKNKLWGLKNLKKIDSLTDFYLLTDSIIDKKTDFSSSLLYLALSDDKVDWETPAYLKTGLSWLAQ
jgi:predicted ATP-dependent endonuclease of OLD family